MATIFTIPTVTHQHVARAEAAGLSHKAEKRKLHMKERQRRLGAGDEESKEGRQAERKRKRCVVACHGVVGTVQ